jgi:hypothetical protein
MARKRMAGKDAPDGTDAGPASSDDTDLQPVSEGLGDDEIRPAREPVDEVTLDYPFSDPAPAPVPEAADAMVEMAEHRFDDPLADAGADDARPQEMRDGTRAAAGSEPDGPAIAPPDESWTRTTPADAVPPLAAAARDHDAHDHDAHDAEDHEADHGPGLAARLLTGLALMAAGAALVIWGGPRLAPHLPEGMAPVRAWLMPGESQAEVAVSALRSDVEARLAALPAPADTSALAADLTASLTARIDAAIAAGREETLAEVSALKDQIAAMDGGALAARLTASETRLQGIAAELEKLSAMLLGVAESGGELNAEAAQQIATFTATVDGLRAELAALAEKNGALSARLEEVAAAADRRVEEAEAEAESAAERAAREAREARIRSALSGLTAALASGEPYDGPLSALDGTGLVASEALSAHAATGVASMAGLRAAFPGAAHAAIRAAIRASAGDGVTGRLGAFIEAQVATRSLTPQEGNSPDAVLSRAEAALREDRLDDALTELEALPTEAMAAMSDWLAQARTRAAAVGALGMLAEDGAADGGATAGTTN